MADESSFEEQRRANYAKIVARSWSDADFKAKLLSDPHNALAEYGIMVPAGTTMRVVEDTQEMRHLVLPPPPEGELSEEDLNEVAGGFLDNTGMLNPDY